jgi:hypothetical protein
MVGIMRVILGGVITIIMIIVRKVVGRISELIILGIHWVRSLLSGGSYLFKESESLSLENVNVGLKFFSFFKLV